MDTHLNFTFKSHNPFNAFVQNTWPVDDCHSALGVATWSCAAVVKPLLFIVRHGELVGDQYIFLDISTPYNVSLTNLSIKIKNFEFPPATHMALNGWHFTPPPVILSITKFKNVRLLKFQ